MADNLVLGRGKMFFAPYSPGSTTGGTKGYFGNTPTLNVASANTKLDHYSAEGGLKVKDRSVLIQTDVTLTFDTDNISVGNLILWFGGKSAGTLPSDAPSDIGTMAFIGAAHQIFGALWFESDNPVGDNLNYWFPYVSLAPNGNYALKGDAWQTLSFTAEALKRDSSTERFYAYTPVGGAASSTAAADTTTAEFTPTTASAGATTLTPATGGTVTAPGTETASSSVSVGYTLTGGTEGWLVYNNGTANVGTPHLVSGASGTATLTAPTAGTYTVKLTSDSAGATVIGTSSSVTVS